MLRPVNGIALAMFRRLIAKRRLRKHFRAVRLAFADRLPPPGTREKLIFYLNHPSWWDPLLCIVLGQRFVPGRHFYAPIDADQLQRYAVLRPLGMFPVQVGTPRGAVQFLRSAEAVLARGHILGITPQGEFADARVRPPRFKPGLGALMARMEARGEQVTAVPVALEYTFWNQRLPEALVAAGVSLATSPGPSAQSADQWTARLEAGLAAVQDELATLSLRRDERDFEVVLNGNSGAAGFYGAWQRLRLGVAPDHQAKTGSMTRPPLPSAHD